MTTYCPKLLGILLLQGELGSARVNVCCDFQLQNPADLPGLTDDDPALPMGDVPASAEALVFGRHASHILLSLHPTVPQIFRLWQTCLDNINPPSVQKMILEAVTEMAHLPESTEALVFAHLHLSGNLNE